MSGEKNLTKVLVAVLTTHERTGWVHPTIMEWVEHHRMQGENTDYAIRLTKLHNFIPAASARNTICRMFKDRTDADWLCMIDNDMAIPDNLLDTIKDAPADAAVVVPVFYLWDESNKVPSLVLCWGTDMIPQSPDDSRIQREYLLHAPGFKELMKAGTGVIFIRRSVVENIPEPWFWYTYGEDQGMKGTEDINFCIKVRGHGLKIYGNPDIEVGHYHNVNLLALSRLVYPRPEEKVSSSDASAASVEVSSPAACPA